MRRLPGEGSQGIVEVHNPDFGRVEVELKQGISLPYAPVVDAPGVDALAMLCTI